jgi:hypothetical protein
MKNTTSTDSKAIYDFDDKENLFLKENIGGKEEIQNYVMKYGKKLLADIHAKNKTRYYKAKFLIHLKMDDKLKDNFAKDMLPNQLDLSKKLLEMSLDYCLKYFNIPIIFHDQNEKELEYLAYTIFYDISLNQNNKYQIAKKNSPMTIESNDIYTTQKIIAQNISKLQCWNHSRFTTEKITLVTIKIKFLFKKLAETVIQDDVRFVELSNSLATKKILIKDHLKEIFNWNSTKNKKAIYLIAVASDLDSIKEIYNYDPKIIRNNNLIIKIAIKRHGLEKILSLFECKDADYIISNLLDDKNKALINDMAEIYAVACNNKTQQINNFQKNIYRAYTQRYKEKLGKNESYLLDSDLKQALVKFKKKFNTERIDNNSIWQKKDNDFCQVFCDDVAFLHLYKYNDSNVQIDFRMYLYAEEGKTMDVVNSLYGAFKRCTSTAIAAKISAQYDRPELVIFSDNLEVLAQLAKELWGSCKGLLQQRHTPMAFSINNIPISFAINKDKSHGENLAIVLSRVLEEYYNAKKSDGLNENIYFDDKIKTDVIDANKNMTNLVIKEEIIDEKVTIRGILNLMLKNLGNINDLSFLSDEQQLIIFQNLK